MDELEKIKSIFLASDVDDDIRQDNEDKIKEWEKSIIESENLKSWQEHDITKSIMRQCKDTYKDLSIILTKNRSLSDEERKSLWGKQDACLFILSLASGDPKSSLKQIQDEINHALSAT